MTSPRRCTVIVFAKAPLPGFAKSRLVSALGEQGAARLAERMLDRAVREAAAARIGEVELCCAPDCSHAAFARLASAHRLRLADQGDGDLGERMHRALAHALENGDHALLIGTDAPGIDAAYLRAARDALQAHDAVFGPTADGGYALVGLRRHALVAPLFERVSWSTARVMATTRERLAAARCTHAELPLLHDIDEPADLAHLEPQWLAGIARTSTTTTETSR